MTGVGKQTLEPEPEPTQSEFTMRMLHSLRHEMHALHEHHQRVFVMVGAIAGAYGIDLELA